MVPYGGVSKATVKEDPSHWQELNMIRLKKIWTDKKVVK